MPARDPRTGKFVSGGAGDRKTIEASYTSTIPAADLAGGTTVTNVTGDESEVVDFTPILENDEIYVLDEMQGRAFMTMPTTATQQGYAVFEYGLTRDYDDSTASISSGFWGGTLSAEDGVVDIVRGQGDDRSALWVSQLAASPSHSDTVNALAAGADFDREPIHRYFHGDDRPAFDRDDELALPHQWQVDDVSDHAVEFDIVLRLDGRVQEV